MYDLENQIYYRNANSLSKCKHVGVILFTLTIKYIIMTRHAMIGDKCRYLIGLNILRFPCEPYHPHT